LATGKPLGEPMKHDAEVASVAFSPKGPMIATATADGMARLWDTTTGNPLGQPIKHTEGVHCVAFSPDGKTIASASGKTIRLWDVATGKPLGEPLKHDYDVHFVTFSPDGTKIATASGGFLDQMGEARLWRVSRPVPDDPSWIAAYVKVVSNYGEDTDHALHSITSELAITQWPEVLKHADWLGYQTTSLLKCQFAMHESDADQAEAASNWFAAVFQLRWLAKMEPNNAEWKQRLAKAEEHLAKVAKTKPK
jgi:dipeptidyl aminopeptidase/acylaminoacyl peptidase